MVPGTGIEPVWPCGRGIFVTLRLSPPAVAVRALDYAFTLTLARCRCSPSSLYTFPLQGLARRCLRIIARGFTEFEEIHTGAFAAWCSIFKSLVSTNFTTPAWGGSFYLRV